MMSTARPEVVDIGVDWFTGSFMDEEKARVAAIDAAKLLHQQEDEGNDIKRWAMSGYQGWCSGHIQTGERTDGLLVRLGGPLAHSEWRRFYALSTNVSRLDAQVTCRVAGSAALTLASAYKVGRRKVRRGGSTPALSYFRSSDGSATLYVGKRTSEMFGRVYNKELESKLDHYKGCLRAEVEMKGSRASWFSAHLADQPGDEFAIASMVPEYFRRSSCPLRYLENSLEPLMSDGLNHAALKWPIPPRGLDDTSARLTFFRTQCRRGARRLVSDGLGPELLNALGLTISAGGELELGESTNDF